MGNSIKRFFLGTITCAGKRGHERVNCVDQA